tara:strand:+ start:262 stop:441 length:180 start_codon:yes stop_codon:yes gene_type:complete
MNKNIISKNTSKNNKTCKLIFKKKNLLGFIKTKNVSIHKKVQARESAIIDLKFLIFLNI